MLKPGGAFCVHSMCGEPTSESIRAQFDPISRCLMRSNGVASRYLGLPEVLTKEVEGAGFNLEHVEVESAATLEDQVMLLILALRN